MSASKAVEKEGGESSDSEAYVSADEGLGSSRGLQKDAPASGGESVKDGGSGPEEEREGEANGDRESEPEGGKGEGEQPSTGEGLSGHSEGRQGMEGGSGGEEIGGMKKQLETIDSAAATEPTEETREGGERPRSSVSEGGGEAGGDGGKDPPGNAERRGSVVRVEAGTAEGEKAPIPPPRRKRKKKLQKAPSLEDLETPSEDVQLHRSMTVGSVDMSRERTSSKSRTPLTPSSPSHPPVVATDTSEHSSSREAKSAQESEERGKRGGKVATRERGEKKGDEPRSSTKSHRHQTGGAFRNSDGGPPARANAPSISIEPNTSLELTEEMVHGRSEVMTRDTLFAKASGSDKHETGIIIDSDDESLDGDGVFGSQELRDVDPDGDVDLGEAGRDLEVARGVGEEGTESEETSGERDQKEKTPLAGEVEGGEDREEGVHRIPSPSDNQILQMTIVKNLDTGDSFPLSVVDEKIPLGNPLNQHLYRRTAAMESHGDEGSGEEGHHRRKPHLKRKLKQFWGKKKHKMQAETMSHMREGEAMPRGNLPATHDPDQSIKYKPSSHHKGPYEFDRVRLKQDLTGPHLGAVWVMEFSICGRLLAVAGQDSIVRVWVLRNAAQFFNELQAKYQRFGVHSSGESLAEKASMASTTSSDEDDANAAKGPFQELPLCTYHGHSADILDLSWSKNFFLLSSSMDKTVRLWHISRKECLCCFQHVDFVTAIAFHPRDDRYFLSGSLDGKLRLWNIPDKRVALWNEIEGVGSHLITAANFCMNGKLAVAGTYDGRCIFYETEHLKYHTQIHVRSRHGKNRGRKISGIEPLPGEDKILVTSNDSRLRLYNLKDHSLSCKYKGGLNTSSQIRSTFSRDGLNIISGSEDHYIYVWKTHHDVNKLSSVRRDRNEFYESFSSHHAPVTAAVFAPVPGITVDQGLKEVGQMIIAADYQGCIKVYVNSDTL